MLNRSIQPNAPFTSYKTYQIVAPLNTHFRKATCAEVECAAQSRGWKSVIDESTTLGQAQAAYIRRDSKRKFVESKNEAGLTEFVFESGQTCFQTHQVSLERPAIFIVKDGDFRGNPTGRHMQHTQPEHWVEDFAEHQDNVAKDRG